MMVKASFSAVVKNSAHLGIEAACESGNILYAGYKNYQLNLSSSSQSLTCRPPFYSTHKPRDYEATTRRKPVKLFQTKATKRNQMNIDDNLVIVHIFLMLCIYCLAFILKKPKINTVNDNQD